MAVEFGWCCMVSEREGRGKGEGRGRWRERENRERKEEKKNGGFPSGEMPETASYVRTMEHYVALTSSRESHHHRSWRDMHAFATCTSLCPEYGYRVLQSTGEYRVHTEYIQRTQRIRNK